MRIADFEKKSETELLQLGGWPTLRRRPNAGLTPLRMPRFLKGAAFELLF
jgi:hypothetical protein